MKCSPKISKPKISETKQKLRENRERERERERERYQFGILEVSFDSGEENDGWRVSSFKHKQGLDQLI